MVQFLTIFDLEFDLSLGTLAYLTICLPSTMLISVIITAVLKFFHGFYLAFRIKKITKQVEALQHSD